MNENSKVMVRIEYLFQGVKMACYGELDEIKLDQYPNIEENFIWMKNNNEIIWIDKNAITRIDELEIRETLRESNSIEMFLQEPDVRILSSTISMII